MSIQEDPFPDHPLCPNAAEKRPVDLPLFSIPVRALIAFIERKTGAPFTPFDLHYQPVEGRHTSLDWHRLVREGFGKTLHLNLGIPGIEDPPHPIEENASALQVAVLLRQPSIEVILSGELDLALEAGLISEKALSNLRNQIRVSG